MSSSGDQATPEQLAFDALVLEAAGITTIDEYKSWVRNRVRPVLPHEMLASGYGHLHAGGVALDYVVTVDFPLSYLEQLRNRAGAIDTPSCAAGSPRRSRSCSRSIAPGLTFRRRGWKSFAKAG